MAGRKVLKPQTPPQFQSFLPSLSATHRKLLLHLSSINASCHPESKPSDSIEFCPPIARMSAIYSSSTRRDGVDTSIRPRVHIYIDNSYIYIQGAKTYQPGSYQNPVADPSWRHDVNRLREVLTCNSQLQFRATTDMVHTTLYGSIPPPGHFWKVIEAREITVHTYDRSTWTGKEKQVDTKMVADITKDAIRAEVSGLQHEFIIVMGDGDIYPSVEAIVESGFRAHVLSWRSSFSNVFKDAWDMNGRQIIKIYYLDHFKDEFGYQQAQFFSKPCKWGIYCRENLNCQYSHLDDDKVYFQQTGGPKPIWRYKPCAFGDSCYRKDAYGYFHHESERVCLTCDQPGRGHGLVHSVEWQRAHGPVSDYK